MLISRQNVSHSTICLGFPKDYKLNLNWIPDRHAWNCSKEKTTWNYHGRSFSVKWRVIKRNQSNGKQLNLPRCGSLVSLFWRNSCGKRAIFVALIRTGWVRLTVDERRSYRNIGVCFYYMESSAIGQDEPNPALWWANRAGNLERYWPQGIARFVPAITFRRGRSGCTKVFFRKIFPVKVKGFSVIYLSGWN